MTVIEKVKEFVKLKKITQKELSDLINKSEQIAINPTDEILKEYCFKKNAFFDFQCFSWILTFFKCSR